MLSEWKRIRFIAELRSRKNSAHVITSVEYQLSVYEALLRRNSIKTKCNFSDQPQMKTCQCVKDFGITIASKLKFSHQCKDAAGKANRTLVFINRNFSFKNKDIILPLSVSLVTPHLEYAGQAFFSTCPCPKRNIGSGYFSPACVQIWQIKCTVATGRNHYLISHTSCPFVYPINILVMWTLIPLCYLLNSNVVGR